MKIKENCTNLAEVRVPDPDVVSRARDEQIAAACREHNVVHRSLVAGSAQLDRPRGTFKVVAVALVCRGNRELGPQVLGVARARLRAIWTRGSAEDVLSLNQYGGAVGRFRTHGRSYG